MQFNHYLGFGYRRWRDVECHASGHGFKYGAGINGFHLAERRVEFSSEVLWVSILLAELVLKIGPAKEYATMVADSVEAMG